MGIPKFYRWISERYPCLSEKIREYQIPDFDNLYLDMNGIIHTCSHPNDDDVHLRIPEEAVFKEIFRYIDFLFKMIKPRKVFFMAIDGVAPRAKMNQQRGRRFRSAKLALDQETEAIKKGEKLPTEERFDSNCITPGTEFMARLHEQLQYFVKVKVSTDSLWQREGLVVYLSGHDVPGEGEHKIMDYIRLIRSQPDYNAETRHCLYGLDADLIMLGLSTHELHFSLLREEVKFGNVRKRKRPQQPPPQSPSEPAKKCLDLSNMSLFKNTEEVDANSVIPGTNGLTDHCVKESVSYADAAKLEHVNDIQDNTHGTSSSQVNLVEKKLIPPPNDSERKKKDTYHPPLPEKTTFLLLHLSLLRDYLDEEFSPLKEKLVGHPCITYNLENIIDDWILMCILVGNDFVPNLPHLHITTNALPMAYGKYMDVLPKLNGYINENGVLNLDRFEVFLRDISVYDIENFRSTYDDMKYMAAKTGKNIVLGDAMMEAFEFDDDGFQEEAIEQQEDVPKTGILSELQDLINRTEESVFGAAKDIATESAGEEDSNEAVLANDSIFDADDSPELRLEFAQSKRNYYMTKMDFKDVQKEVKQLAIEYIRAVQWVLLYYYKGVSSWCWYYPSHYAPFTSDLVNFKDLRITFEKGKPFKPFEQLLGVLPAHSKKLLPQCYQGLMTSSDSPIIQYYPEKFEQDLNGKKQDWEAVVLIPFIDETQLLKAMEMESSKLTESEQFRNSRGQLLVYSYDKNDTGPVESPGSKFPCLQSSHYHVVGLDDVLYNPSVLPKGLHPKAKLDVIYQGFPTIKSISHRGYLMDAQVKVFDMTARDLSMVLDLTPELPESDNRKKMKVEEVLPLLGKVVWVNWPHLTPTLVVAVSDENAKYVLKDRHSKPVKDGKHTPTEQQKVVEGLVKRHMMCKAIKIGDVDIVLWGKLMDGRRVRCDKNGRVIVENQWQQVPQPFAYQTTITSDEEINVFSITDSNVNNFADLFRPGDTVFVLDEETFGAKAIIKGHDIKRSKIVVEYNIPVFRNVNHEADKDIYFALRKWNENNYFNTHDAARKCKLDAYTFSKISGSIFVTVEKGQSPKKKSKGFGKRRNRDRATEDDVDKSSSEEEIHLAQETKKVNVGLDLKFNKRNQKARGYTTKDLGAGDRLKWAYSSKTVKLVQEFVTRFPEFVQYLSKSSNSARNNDTYLATDIFRDDPIGKIKQMQDWIDGLGLRHSVQRIDISSDILDDDEIQIIWNHIVGCKMIAQPSMLKTRNVAPHMLFKPGLNRGSVQPVKGQTFQILDRVVCVDESASLPLGHRGTVVGIQEPQFRGQDEEIEENFKATNASLVLTLTVLVDPHPDVFDKVSEPELQGSPSHLVKKDLAVALNQFLGIAPKTDEAEEKAEVPAKVAEDKPIPKLVKLFPYQVINITGSEVEEYVNATSEVINGDKKLVCAPESKLKATNNRAGKIPSLLSLNNSVVVPTKGKSKTVPVPSKYANFVKSTSDSLEVPTKADGSMPTPKRIHQRGTNEAKSADTKMLESLLDSAFTGQDSRSKKQSGNNHTPKHNVKPTAASGESSNTTSVFSKDNNHFENRPITILKRPQPLLETELGKANSSLSSASAQVTAIAGNKIINLLENSLEHHRATQVKKGANNCNNNNKKDARKETSRPVPNSNDFKSEKPRRKGDKQDNRKRSEKNKEDQGKVRGAQAQKQPPVQVPGSNPQVQGPNLLFELLQQPVPNTSQTQKPAIAPSAFPPPPPIPMTRASLERQQHLFRPPFPAQQVQQPPPTLMHNPALIFTQQQILTQQGPMLVHIPVPVATAAHHLVSLNQIPAKHSMQPNRRTAGQNPAPVNKIMASFVPTQVLSGRRPPTACTKGSIHGKTANVNSEATNNAMESNSMNNEVPLDNLLQEAEIKREHVKVATNLETSSRGQNSNSDFDLSCLSNNLQSLIVSQPANVTVANCEDDIPRKSRLAANFNFDA